MKPKLLQNGISGIRLDLENISAGVHPKFAEKWHFSKQDILILVPGLIIILLIFFHKLISAKRELATKQSYAITNL